MIQTSHPAPQTHSAFIWEAWRNPPNRSGRSKRGKEHRSASSECETWMNQICSLIKQVSIDHRFFEQALQQGLHLRGLAEPAKQKRQVQTGKRTSQCFIWMWDVDESNLLSYKAGFNRPSLFRTGAAAGPSSERPGGTRQTEAAGPNGEKNIAVLHLNVRRGWIKFALVKQVSIHRRFFEQALQQSPQAMELVMKHHLASFQNHTDSKSLNRFFLGSKSHWKFWLFT